MRPLTIFVVLTLLLLGSPIPSATTMAQSGGPCTLVELQPGYPGYRGFVTGLYGVGEGACLEDLQVAYPGFDPAAEDAANAAAAARLGISGDASTWLWENWLAIEAERGMIPTCYQDARAAMEDGAAYIRAAEFPGDARLEVGMPGTTNWIDRVSDNFGANTAQMREYFADDLYFRAGAWGMTGETNPNAWALKSGGDALMSAVNSPGGGPPATYRLVVFQGGYAPVPANACPEDQWFFAGVSMLTMFWSSPLVSAYMGELEQLHQNWLNDVVYTGGGQSLREYLAENWEGAP
ncbi:MAG: hypothetical protein QM692_08880 [Thermomicrobiales bacterium]